MTELSFRDAALVAAGAVIGALGRWVAGAYLTREFPYGTLAVNVVGSFLIGVVMFGGIARGWWGADARLFFAIGVLGSFTTMSAFAYESVSMIERGQWAGAMLHFVGNPVLCLVSTFAGRALVLSWP